MNEIRVSYLGSVPSFETPACGRPIRTNQSRPLVRGGDSIVAVNLESPLMPAVFSLRHAVFVVEQAVPSELERDEFDDVAIHLAAMRNGDIVGTLRIVTVGETAKIGRMAVAKSLRGTGIGSQLMRRAELLAREMGARELMLHAQLAAKEFYSRLGFREHGDLFEEAGILHVSMRKAIAQSTTAAPSFFPGSNS